MSVVAQCRILHFPTQARPLEWALVIRVLVGPVRPPPWVGIDAVPLDVPVLAVGAHRMGACMALQGALLVNFSVRVGLGTIQNQRVVAMGKEGGRGGVSYKSILKEYLKGLLKAPVLRVAYKNLKSLL